MLHSTYLSGTVLVWLVANGSTKAEPAASRPAGATEEDLVVRVVDADGEPVEYARVGEGAGRSVEDGGSGFRLWGQRGYSDEDGFILFHGENLFPDRQRRAGNGTVLLYGVHELLELTGFLEVSREDIGRQVTLKLAPDCCIAGRLRSPGLEKLGRELTWANVYLYRGDARPLQCTTTTGWFELRVPPGEYILHAYGTDAATVRKEIRIEPGQRELAVEIDLPAERLAELVGQPAPELQQIKEWKNGGPVTLAELRGKVVLLEFWGYWCGPCVAAMPDLMALHDALAKHGLVIVAVHDDSAASIAEMDERLASIREKRWGGRDLPFLVALDGGGEVPIEGTDRTARGATTAAYGITGFPTTVLIGRDGRVIGRDRVHGEQARAELEELLGIERLAGSQPEAANDDAWRKRFEAVYRLREGEIVKRIAPPFIPERLEYYRHEHAGQAGLIADPPDYFTFHWTGELRGWGLGFTDRLDVSAALGHVGLAGNEYEGSNELLELKVRGDWIIDMETPKEQRVRALEALLRDELGYQLRSEQRPVEREVIVATGRFDLKPLVGVASYDDRSVHIYADRLDRDEGAGGGTDDLERFLRHIGGRLNRWVIDETTAPADLKVSWANHKSSRLRGMAEGPDKAERVEMVLDHIARQTSLEFRPERRTMEMWFITAEP